MLYALGAFSPSQALLRDYEAQRVVDLISFIVSVFTLRNP
jgi:hypothetical protein